MFVNGTQFSKIFLDDFSLLTHQDPGLVVQERVTFPPQKEPERTTLSLEQNEGVCSVRLAIRSDDGLTLETSAFKLFTVANSRYKLSW